VGTFQLSFTPPLAQTSSYATACKVLYRKCATAKAFYTVSSDLTLSFHSHRFIHFSSHFIHFAAHVVMRRTYPDHSQSQALEPKTCHKKDRLKLIWAAKNYLSVL